MADERIYEVGAIMATGNRTQASEMDMQLTLRQLFYKVNEKPL
jgi:hypothetical protein